MIQNDKGIVGFKHRIMEDVARLAWNDQLDEEHMEELVYDVIPGPRPTYRCCVYKEREIVRQRVRLATARNTRANKDSTNEVQVIKPACDECSIASYSVTDNCRLCLGKPCLSACKFGAISQGEFRTHIDAAKCKECGLCAKECPFGAIVHLVRPCKKACPVDAISFDENGFCRIDEEKCINCGHCIHNCPFGAIGSKTYLTEIIREIKAGKEIYAMCAPAAEGQFGDDITMQSIRVALKKIGFTDMVEVGLGGDMTAAFEAEEWSEAYKEGKKMTTSCCPAFINMLKKHFPEQYEENMSGTVSPMCAVSRYLKYLHPGCVTVFVGPCIAKKTEAKDSSVPDNADYVITFGELKSLFKSANVTLEPVDEPYQEASLFGKKFAGSGGEVMKERGEDTSEIKLETCAGGEECRKALMLLKMGKMPADFIEGMMCAGGCVGGPSNSVPANEINKARTKLFDQADDRKVLDNLKAYPMDRFSMKRSGEM